jgi:SAM-dependent methyltransferase
MDRDWAAGDGARETYDDHAPTYDLFLRDYQYERWSTKLLGLVEAAGLKGKRLFDVGCGTGLSCIVPLDQGFDVTGCDVSPGMIELAKARLGKRARLMVADMRELPQLGPFDLLWAVNDAVNYLLGRDELETALSGMRANLGPDGILLFDLNTLRAYKTFFCEMHTVENEGQTMTWEGLMEPWQVHAGSVCQARYTVGEPSGTTTIHRQRHFPRREVLAAMEATGLTCIGVHGELEGELSQPLDEYRHTKAVYLARPA